MLFQQSSYSELPDDISELILLAPTQLINSVSSGSASSKAGPSESSSGGLPSSSSVASDQATSSNSSTGASSKILAVSAPPQSRTTDVANRRVHPVQVLGKRKSRDSEPWSPQGPPKPFKSARLAKIQDDKFDEPVVIVHSAYHQRLFHKHGLPYGVQYEIARIASTLPTSYETLDESYLVTLQEAGTNTKAVPLVPGVFGGKVQTSVDRHAFAKEIAARSPLEELDLEDQYLAKNPLAGLGFSEDAPDWFGGKVHFTAKLVADPKNKDTPFKVLLQPPELGPSDRFARRWGSRRFLTIRVSKDLLNKGDAVEKFMYRPFILMNDIFRAYDAKEGNVFLVNTNEKVEGLKINPNRTVPGLLSLLDFLKWHNPLELDLKQTMAKWASRFALGRSNSAPVLLLDEDAITHIPDMNSEAGSDMTDGAGLINKAGLRLIYNRVEMDTWPTAIQCRVAGAKGLLVYHPTDTHENPRIWLRPSQIKVKHKSVEDPALRTIDLLRSSHAKTECRLPIETIINLAENGVPSSAFIKLVEEALVTLVTPLITWEGENAMENLWCAVARAGGVMSQRMAREEKVLARVKGYLERVNEDLENDKEEETISEQPKSVAWWVDQISGCPSSLEETVMYLLDAGFTPWTCSVLRSKLEKVVKSCVDRYIESYVIDIPFGMSGMAFLVPDELGVLEAGEFFFKSSHRDMRTLDGLPTDTLLGPALITRHPCKLPTDVQKWIAVDRPELRHFTDVIVCSTRGPRRAADFLSGGDYDGDKGLVIWQPDLVASFVNAPLHYSEEPSSVAAAFLPHNETVGDFLQRTASDSPGQQVRKMQHFLFSALRDLSVVGKYSKWHLNSIYAQGYTHPDTIRLAYMFCKTLDGAKTGLRVDPKQFKQDSSKYDKRVPLWKEAEKKTKEKGRPEVADWTNTANLSRGEGLHTFIMDKLHKHADRGTWGTTWGKELKEKINEKFSSSHIVDADLTAPWLEYEQKESEKMEGAAQRRADIERVANLMLNAENISWEDRETAERLLEEVEVASDGEKIKAHVESVYTKHKSRITHKFTSLPIEKRQDILRELSRDFAVGPKDLSMSAEEAARIKASYAYFYDSEQHRAKRYPPYWSRFPWDVAFRELCLIKTRSSKTVSMKPVNSEFYERFHIKLPRR